MSYILFLDDVRQPIYIPGTGSFADWLASCRVARNVQEAQELILKQGEPEVLSLDHDLGWMEPTAMVFLHWLIEMHMDLYINLDLVKTVIIHSANPVGAENLRGLWDGFAADSGSPVRAVKQPRA